MTGPAEPFDPPEVRKRVRAILESGVVSPSSHALQEMEKDDLTMVDCLNGLRGGWAEPGEWENGTWRYRVRTARLCVVIAFRSETKLSIVTAWRERP